jgi:hypothetical protein
MARLLSVVLFAWLGGGCALLAASTSATLVHVIMAANHGVMFCHGCEDPLREGSYGGYVCMCVDAVIDIANGP